jgi:iron(III) transport system ATP-binding protein
VARIELRGLSRRFGSHVALHPLDLTMEDGEFVTLLGPSGCGKTTTLRLLAGFMAPDDGEIWVDGQMISSPAGTVPPERREMGMVFQSYALWPHMTVFENVAFGLRVQRVPTASRRQRVEQALDLVGLTGLGNRLPSALSGGQQQRVALARSLVTEPSILLLDEPLSNLDVNLRERMRDELKDLHARTGITFVYVTHDQAEAIALSSRIAVMESGRLRQYATPIDIYERPADRFVAGFMGAANLLDARVLASAATLGSLGRVALPGGTMLDIPLQPGLAVGTQVTLMMRPEDLEIGVTAAEGLAIPVVVKHASLLGHSMEYLVELDSAVLRVNARRDAHHAVGSTVLLTVRPERCAVIPEAAAVQRTD